LCIGHTILTTISPPPAAQFDVLRKGKSDFTTGKVTRIDFSGKVKRIKFHFAKTTSKQDEWIEFRSLRIAALYSKTPVPDKTADKKRLIFDVSRDETAKHPTSQLKAAKASGSKSGKKKPRLNETKESTSPKPESVDQDETAKNPHSQVKVVKEPGAKKGKKKARLDEAKGISSSKLDSVAQEGKKEKKINAKKGKRKAQLNEAEGIMASNLNSAAQDETVKHPTSQVKVVKEPGAKKGKKKARLNEAKGVMSSKIDSVAQDEIAKDPLSQGKGEKEPGAKKKKKKAKLNEVVLGENDSVPLSPLNHGLSTKIPKKKRVSNFPSNVQTATGATFGGEAVSDKEEGSRLRNAYEGHGREATHYPSYNTAGGSPQFAVAMTTESYGSGGTNGGMHLGSNSTGFYQHPQGQRPSPSSSSATRQPDFTTDAAPMSSPFDQLVRLASVANASTSNASHFDSTFSQHIPQPSNGSPPFDQLLRLASVANVPPSNGSHFDHSYSQNFPQPSNGSPSGGQSFGYDQPHFHDSRSRMQPADFPPPTSAPQDPSYQREGDGAAANFDQYRYQDRQTHDQHPPRYYR
jgi:hypothetical protein